MKGIIGNSGFVGGNIIKQATFDTFYNSKNINQIQRKKFELLVCAAPSAAKWKANQDPATDWQLIKGLISNLAQVETKLFVHISTVDVFPQPARGNEDSVIDSESNHAYGRHRYYLEEFIKSKFNNHLIVRLPALFGSGLKKNFIYDLCHNSNLELTHYQSKFQFYNLNNIWQDVQVALMHGLKLVNFATEPIAAEEIARLCFDKEFTNITPQPPAVYELQSKFAQYFGGVDEYLYTKSDIIKDVLKFKESAKV